MPSDAETEGAGTPSPAPGHEALRHFFDSPHFQALRRRKLVRVALLYVMACWLILEPVHVVFHMLHVPDWANQLVIVAMALGLPIVMLAAWAYGRAPEAAHGTTHGAGRRLERTIIAVLVLAVAYLAVDKLWLSKRQVSNAVEPSIASAQPTAATPTAKDVSIAVLPFVDMSENKDQEYFSDGLSEELINRLAQTPRLRVIARTSSFQFKDRNEDARKIGEQLGVANLLEGSVRKSGQTLRVTAQLIKASDGSHLWSKTYERALDDVFKVQDEICAAVVQALRGALGRNTGHTSEEPQNLQAYNALLRANYLDMQGTKAAMDEAIALYKEALRLEPGYARAWAQLGGAYLARALGGWIRPELGYQQAREAVQQALALDPELPLAHAMLGDILMSAEWDWAGAEREFARAQTLHGATTSGTLTRRATIAQAFGRLDEAISLYRQALLLDPLGALWPLGVCLIDAGRLEEAEEIWRRQLSVSPSGAAGHYFLGMTFLERGDYARALTEMQQETDDAWRLIGLSMAYWTLGQRAESDAALKKLQAEHADGSSFNIAEIYAFRGERQLALEWLEHAYEKKDGGMYWLTTNVHFKSLREEPRFRALVRKLNLSPDRRDASTGTAASITRRPEDQNFTAPVMP